MPLNIFESNCLWIASVTCSVITLACCSVVPAGTEIFIFSVIFWVTLLVTLWLFVEFVLNLDKSGFKRTGSIFTNLLSCVLVTFNPLVGSTKELSSGANWVCRFFTNLTVGLSKVCRFSTNSILLLLGSLTTVTFSPVFLSTKLISSLALLVFFSLPTD